MFIFQLIYYLFGNKHHMNITTIFFRYIKVIALIIYSSNATDTFISKYLLY